MPERPTLLHYIAGILALTLVCFCLLCLYFYVTPAHASSGYQQAAGKTMTGQVAFGETETDTPSRTPTHTPTSTVTATPSPIPSPSVTRTSTPLPTSTSVATATAHPSTAATGKQTPSPVHMSVSTAGQGINGDQTSNSTTAPGSNQGNQSNQGGNQSDNVFQFVSLGVFLGSMALLGLLVPACWMIVRRRKLSRRSQKWSPGDTVAWINTPTNDPYNSTFAQRTFDLATSQGGVFTNDQRDQAVHYGAAYQNLPLSEENKEMSDTDVRATVQSFLF